MKTNLEIDTRTFIRFWAVIAGIVVALYLINAASTALFIIGAALFLALGLNIPVTFIAKKLPGKSRVLPIAVAYVAVVSVLVGLIIFVIPPIIHQTVKFLEGLPSLVNSFTTQWKQVGDFINQYNLQPQLNAALDSIQSAALKWAGSIGSNVLAGLGSIIDIITQILLILFIAFFMLVEAPMWKKRLQSLYTNEDKMKKHSQVINRMVGVVSGYITGQLTVSAIGGLFAGLAVFVLSLISKDIPMSLAVPAAVISFLLSLIPLFGASIGGVIVALLLLFSWPPAAIFYLIYFVVYQQLENNLIAPRIQSKRVSLSALAVLVAVTIGIYMFGLAGAIIAIPVAGCIKVLIDEYAMEALEKRRQAARSK